MSFKRLAGTIIGAVFMVLIGTLVARGGWLNSNTNPPNVNVAPPLDVSNVPQIKNGGLTINKNLYPWGLIISGAVGIGTNNPSEKLGLAGNMAITGIIEPLVNGAFNAGADNQILVSTQNGFDWQDRKTWMTLMGDPVMSPGGPGNCAASGAQAPPDCQTFGYTTYQTDCATDQGYDVYVNTCYKTF